MSENGYWSDKLCRHFLCLRVEAQSIWQGPAPSTYIRGRKQVHLLPTLTYEGITSSPIKLTNNCHAALLVADFTIGRKTFPTAFFALGSPRYDIVPLKLLASIIIHQSEPNNLESKFTRRPVLLHPLAQVRREARIL